MIQKTKRATKIENFTLILMLFSAASSSSKFEFGVRIESTSKVNFVCSLPDRRYLLSLRLKQVDSAVPISINLANPTPTTEFITDPDNPPNKLYGSYQPGSTCYMHDHRTTRNIFPFLVYVLKQATSGQKDCIIEGIITNKGIIPCSGTTKPLDEILQPKDESGNSASLSNFRSIEVDLNYKDNSLDTLSITMLNAFLISDINEPYVETLLLQPFWSAPKAPNGASQLSSERFSVLQNTAQHNSYVLKRDISKVFTRMLWDDLPGYHLLPYQGPSGDAANFYQGSLFLYHKAEASTSIHLLMYMSDPHLLTQGKEHILDIESRALKKSASEIAGYTNYHYQLKILRTSTHIDFKVFREGSTLSCSISLPYTGSTDFVYFGFTFGEGILGFKDSVNVKAKRYETLVLFHEGNKFNDIQTYVYDTTVEKVVRRTNSHADERWFKVQLIPAAGITTNEAGIRVYEGCVGIGDYPPQLISSKALDAKFSDCFFVGYSGCLAYPLLKNKAQTQVLVIRYSGTHLKEFSPGSAMQKNCRVPFTDTLCSIPMTGSTANIAGGGRNRLYDNMATLTEFEAMSQDDKNVFGKFVSNKGTTYLVPCPGSCKYSSLNVIPR